MQRGVKTFTFALCVGGVTSFHKFDETRARASPIAHARLGAADRLADPPLGFLLLCCADAELCRTITRTDMCLPTVSPAHRGAHQPTRRADGAAAALLGARGGDQPSRPRRPAAQLSHRVLCFTKRNQIALGQWSHRERGDAARAVRWAPAHLLTASLLACDKLGPPARCCEGERGHERSRAQCGARLRALASRVV